MKHFASLGEAGSNSNTIECENRSLESDAHQRLGTSNQSPHWLDRLTQHCHILETGSDSFRFKNTSAHEPKTTKVKTRNLTNRRPETCLTGGQISLETPGQFSVAINNLTYPFVLSWTLLKAMRDRALVIASDTAPVREISRDGDNGLLVDFFHPEQLAASVIRPIAEPGDFEKIRARARETIVNEYDRDVQLPSQVVEGGKRG